MGLGCGLNKQLKNFFDRKPDSLLKQTEKMGRRKGSGELPLTHSYPEIHSGEHLPAITEMSEDSATGGNFLLCSLIIVSEF
ncbi:hypothetical protein EB796_014855 [Bugula neritina]|uniref:Uncharacterized protein n=1 Tax=Bugula neritina TaxID=10212 RepID=A0A7J7JMG8_BUGNE|nr:hypothetical protein EB796_014855 [Bugula neritina]